MLLKRDVAARLVGLADQVISAWGEMPAYEHTRELLEVAVNALYYAGELADAKAPPLPRPKRAPRLIRNPEARDCGPEPPEPLVDCDGR